MPRTLTIVAALSFVALSAKAQDYDAAKSFTPEFGEAAAKGKPACMLSSITHGTGAHAELLPLKAGSIELPSGFTTQPQKRPKSKQWTSPDSTTFSVLVDSFPMSGLAHSGGGRYQGERTCALAVSGHHARVDQGRFVTATDTLFLATIAVFAKVGGVVNATIEAHSAARRDELLARLSAASLTK